MLLVCVDLRTFIGCLSFSNRSMSSVLAEIIIIGTGARTYPLPPFLRKFLHNLGMQIEVMASVSITRHLICQVQLNNI